MKAPNPLPRFWGAALALALVLLWGGAAFAQAVLAARVNGAPIAHELLDRQYEELLRERRLQVARMQDPSKAKGIKREALDNLIRIELLWQQAKADGLAASDAEVDAAVAQARGRFRNAEAFLRRIEQSGFSEASYREHTRKLLSGERVAQRIVERDVKVTEQDIEEFYEINPRLFKRNEQLKLRQILVAVPATASAAQKAEARRKIDALLARARAGESFEALAREHSEHATRQWGGALDAVVRGEHPGHFDNAAFALAEGAISEVVEADTGLYILKLDERVAAASIALADARERIRSYLLETRGKAAIEREVEALRALGDVKLLTPL
jgi:parvulin-like peptidyl-prolyl isomerase